jgi:hypothetical protein
MVYNNLDVFFAPLPIPFGGRKESGWIAECKKEGWNTPNGRLDWQAVEKRFSTTRRRLSRSPAQ